MITTVKIGFVLLALLGANFVQAQKCKCTPASPEDKTSWGQQNVILKWEAPVKMLRGQVVVAANEKPLAGVLVEVYDKPESLLKEWQEREAGKLSQRRIAACVTGPDGQFCFPNLPPGKYELRSSKPVEWDPTSIYIEVAPNGGRSTNAKVVVPLHVSK